MDIIVNGARGRMGQEVCRLLQETIALSLSMESVPGASEESCGNYRDLDLRDGVEALQAFLPKCVKRAYKPL